MTDKDGVQGAHTYLSVLMFKDGPSGMWVAQALEHDICAHGPTVRDAQIAFERVLNAYWVRDAQHNREPLSSLPRAPEVFWRVWNRVKAKQVQSIETTDSSAPPAYVVQAITEEEPAMAM